MLWIFRFLAGFLKVEFSGDFSEQIINLAAQNRIALWDMHCRKRHITGCIALRDFRSLREIRRGTGVRVHILERHGIPFWAHRYRHRIGFFVGAVLFFAILEVMSCFVWTVNVSGNSAVSQEEIIAGCETIGITPGMLKSRLDTASGPQRLMLQLPDLAWASMNIEGCMLTVNVSEVRGMPDAQDEKPSNLKSAADGIIEKIDVVSGNVIVHVGDTVKQGDLLVSGIIEEMNGTRFVPSSGTVTARTQRSFAVSGAYEQQIDRKTGVIHRHTVLNVFGLKIPLYLGRIRGDYIPSLETRSMMLFGKTMPLSLTTLTCEMTQNDTVHYDREELTALLYRELEQQIASCGISEYTLSDEQLVDTSDGLSLQCVVTAHENIAVREILLIQQEIDFSS